MTLIDLKFLTMLAIIENDVNNKKNKSYPIENAWRWIARILNLEFKPITIHLINAFLECGAYSLKIKYGNQFIKILNVIKTIDINDPPMKIVKTNMEDYLKKPKFMVFMT